jgi:hypothetical protein
MILDRHRGLLNGAKDHLEGYPPLIHKWCSCHFVINIWKKQLSKEVLVRLKALCNVKEEKKFEARLKELEKILNYDANAWLFEQLPKKSKWALSFDEAGSRYGIMTINISEVFNFVLKGICSLPVSCIMDYTFHKCNEYFVSRWEKARQSLAKGERWGNLQENTFLNRLRYQIMKLSCCLIPRSLCMRLSHQAGLVLVVRYQEDTYSKLRSTLP